jgi:hypothetical protein
MFYFQKPILPKTIGTSFLIIICLLWKTVLANPIISPSGECPPTNDECQNSQSNIDENCLRLRFEGNRQIILPNVNLYREPYLNEPIRNNQLVFRDKVIVLKGKVGYLRASLVRASGQRCGWIREDAILGSNSPLLVKDIKGVKGFDDEDNKLNAKVLVDSVPLYDAVGGREIGRLQIFGIYNIYTYRNYQDEIYFLVGQKVTEKMLEPVLLGWVKADEVIPWSNAMNLYYAPGKKNIPIYGSERDAIRQVYPIVIQREMYVEPKKNNIPRFPLLDHRRVNKNVTIYKIVFAGNFCLSHIYFSSHKHLQSYYKNCTQLVKQSYVRQNNNDPDFTFWLSISLWTFNELNARTKALCGALQYRSNYNDIRDAMMGTLEVVTGDKPGPNDNIGKFLSKRLHVPKENFSELLDKSLNEFVNWYVSPDTPQKQTTQFKSNICLKAAMLDQVANNKRVDMNNDMMFDERQAKWQPKPGAKIENFNWMWGAENGIRYLYIPLEYIP